MSFHVTEMVNSINHVKATEKLNSGNSAFSLIVFLFHYYNFDETADFFCPQNILLILLQVLTLLQLRKQSLVR